MLAQCMLLVAFCGWAQQPPDTWNLAQLMGELAQRQHGHARFIETKHLRLLSGPLTLTGTLSFRAPDRLEKHTLTPNEEVLIVQGDQLSVEIKARRIRREFALQEHPVLWGFVESIRATLSGDMAALSRFYHAQLAGERGKWRLTLTPRERRMRALIRQIRIDGAGPRVLRIDIEETGGDRSVMNIREEEE
jgi:hypothetical protein